MSSITHGKTYTSWCRMKSRCSTDPNYRDYKNYGAKGITVCDRWVNNFNNFLKDMGDMPEGMSLDRIDNKKGYSPDNCRWATHFDQNQHLSMRFDNKSGYKCVSKSGNKFEVGIQRFNKRHRLGKFDSLDKAVLARNKKLVELGIDVETFDS